MFAQGADEIFRQGIALVNITADFADEALLAFGFRLRLYICVVVGVGHGFAVREHAGLGDGADEHTVCLKIHILFHLEGEERVDISGQEHQAVIGAQEVAVGKFVRVAAGLEAGKEAVK